MPFSFYNRLSSAQKKTYRRSDQIHFVAIGDVSPLIPIISQLKNALEQDQRATAEHACRNLLQELSTRLKVPPLSITVYEARPRDSSGELHGYYVPLDEHKPAHISLWMRTAQQKKVVAFKTFLRTLLHELCHHLDYELYGLEETFHTEGFYKRESSLLRQLLQEEPRSALAK